MKLMPVVRDLWSTGKPILLVVTVLVLFQVLFLKSRVEQPKLFIGAVVLSIAGLFLFLAGAGKSLVPLADSIGTNLVRLDHKWLIVLFGLALGYASTLVEPALQLLAMQVQEVSVGVVTKKMLVHTVAIGFALGIGIGLLKILFLIPLKPIIIPLFILIAILAFFAPENILGIALDSAGATTGPVNIPINLAIGLGLARIIEGSDPLLFGFGLIGLTALCATTSVLILGIILLR